MAATPDDAPAEQPAVNKELASKEVDEVAASQDTMSPNEAEAAKAPAASETAPLATAEDVKVKFTGGANKEGGDDDVRVEMGQGKQPKDEYTAMKKSELMKYAKDPFWVAVRWGLFILLWVAWLGMLAGAIVIIVYAPKCPPPKPKQWWQKAPIYEVYTKSFKDSNGDGTGDLKGVESKLDYLKSLGVGSVALTPIYRSPMKDNGYDIQHFIDVDPVFGSLNDFEDLVEAMHERGLKLIMDFVPNHSSDQHEWFKMSVNRKDPHTDFYIWRDGKDGGPPTNWMSVFGGSAWEFNADRNQYYLHQFYKETPDLNLRNDIVVAELKEVLRFWLDLGVDGFRIDGVAHFFEDEDFRDESPTSGVGYASVDHSRTFDQPENIVLLKKFREVLDNKTEEDVYNPRIMMTEAYLTVEDMGKYYGDVHDQIGSISHMPINFELISNFKSPADVTADKVYETLTSYLNGLPEETVAEGEEAADVGDDAKKNPLGRAWSNINTGNHDNTRFVNRFGPKLMDVMNMILMLLQGTPINYYGDEIGMSDSPTGTDGERDLYRTPMQWTDDDPSAGFSTADGWLKVGSQFKSVNVRAQQGDGPSHLKVYKQLAKFRHHDSVLFGSTEFVKNGTFFGFTRIRKGSPGILVAVNFGDEEIVRDVTGLKHVPSQGNVEVMGSEFYDPEVRAIKLAGLKLKPKEGLVITFVPNYG